jgi:hypothetical protein
MDVLHSDIRYYFEDKINNLDTQVVLDIQKVQNILLDCFDGRIYKKF